MIITIDNIDFEIIQYSIEELYSNIKITTRTNNKNYMAVKKIFDNTFVANYARHYKYDIDFKFLKIYGLFPIDYTFNQYYIEVTFSADYIEGDFELLKKQKMRKEKLKKLNDICQKYS